MKHNQSVLTTPEGIKIPVPNNAVNAGKDSWLHQAKNVGKSGGGGKGSGKNVGKANDLVKDSGKVPQFITDNRVPSDNETILARLYRHLKI